MQNFIWQVLSRVRCFFCGVAILFLSGQCRPARVNGSGGKKVYVIAHRGDWRNAPENSLQAIKNSINMGVDVAEIDLKKTRDGRLILLHDNSLDRTTTGKGSPLEYSLRGIKAFRLRNGYGVHTRHQVPDLRELLELAKGKIFINIDKGFEYLGEVLKVLQETGTSGQVIFNISPDIGFDSVTKKYPQIAGSGIFIMPVIDLGRKDAIQIAESYLVYHRTIFQFIFKTDTLSAISIIPRMRRRGFGVWVNALWPELCGGHDDDRAVELSDPAGSWGWMVRLGVNFIQTDRPQLLLRYLQDHGKRGPASLP